MIKCILPFLLYCLFLACISNVGTDSANLNSGGTSDETIVRTGAIVYEQDGTTPAVGAIVKVFKPDAIDGQLSSIKITDRNGRYTLDDVQPGLFNIWVEKDSMVTFRDSVCISNDEQNLLIDTLDCASSLSGYTALQPLYDPRSVTIQVLGTDKIIDEVDANGHFILKGMPGGKFTLLLTCKYSEYVASTRHVMLSNCTNDTLNDTIKIVDTNLTLWAKKFNSLDQFSRNIAIEDDTGTSEPPTGPNLKMHQIQQTEYSKPGMYSPINKSIPFRFP